jgi:uncharacterized membrane protein
MYNRRSSYSSPTVLGIDEKFERPLVYVLGWITGLIFLVIERRNAAVRRHAYQSLVVFGALTVIAILIGLLGAVTGWIPLLGGIIGLGLGAVGFILGLITLLAWLLFMLLAFMSPETFIGNRRELM